MVRTQIQLTEEQARKLKRVAGERGVSMAAVIRGGVDEVLGRAERRRSRERALAVMGRHNGGRGDVSEDHDRYLDDAYTA